jgi:hypothetical protein
LLKQAIRRIAPSEPTSCPLFTVATMMLKLFLVSRKHFGKIKGQLNWDTLLWPIQSERIGRRKIGSVEPVTATAGCVWRY